ncbi:MAG: type II secretion system protein [Patescibacteria group bacterium]|nr:type II secretion system protein [Patescibacteria group bacterium]MDD4610864.1 type II secretion system protein [Patescibacteria group bacterium]
MKNKKGFTLIELLVVIAILGLLATLALVSLGSARGKARDVRRLSDIKQMQTALEMYYTASSTYPIDLTDTLFLTYMKQVPQDPSPSSCTGAENNYTYAQTGTPAGSSYTIQYCLEAVAAGAPESVVGNLNYATPGSIADN